MAIISSRIGANAAVETVRHHHAWERWLCAANVPGANHFADNIIAAEAIPALASFQVNAGNVSWGAWVQLMGSDDSPVQAGMTFFDPHELELTAVQRDQSIHVLQIGYGATGAAVLTAGTYSDVIFMPDDGPPKAAPVPIPARVERFPVDSNVWARLWVPGQILGTLDFLLGIHEYRV